MIEGTFEMSRPYFDNSDPTHEASHWASLALNRAAKLADEKFTKEQLEAHPEFVIEIAKMIVGFVGRKESAPDSPSSDLAEIAAAIRDIE